MSDEKVCRVAEKWRQSAWIDAQAYRDWYRRSIDDPDAFWAEHGRRIDWSTPYTQVRDVDYGENARIRWFHIAAALALNQKDVVMVFPEETIGARAFPRAIGLFLNEFYRQQGIEIHTGEHVAGIKQHDKRFILHTAGSTTIETDCVVAGLGIEPNVALAHSAGLEVDNGIVVDELLRTRHPDVYAAGDVATFWSDALDKRARVEHEDNAKSMGEQAGRNMAGEPARYARLPFFYSDLFHLGYEAVGELDSRLRTVIDWSDPYRKGVVYYLADNRVRGVLLWNVWDTVDAARELITEREEVLFSDLIGRLAA